MSNETIKIKWTVQTWAVGSRCGGEEEFSREDWENMSESEREKAMSEIVFGSGMVEWNWYEEDEE